MKIKREIVEATYSLEELTVEEFNLIRFGLREVIKEGYRASPYLDKRSELAKSVLDKLENEI